MSETIAWMIAACGVVALVAALMLNAAAKRLLAEAMQTRCIDPCPQCGYEPPSTQMEVHFDA